MLRDSHGLSIHAEVANDAPSDLVRIVCCTSRHISYRTSSMCWHDGPHVFLALPANGDLGLLVLHRLDQ
jgi:hypothetical protein